MPSRVKRESTAFSAFSQAQTTTSTFLPSASQRDITPFAAVLDKEPIRPPNVTGRSDIANFSVAEHLKQILQSDEHPAPPPPSPTAIHTAFKTGPTMLPRRAEGAANRLLSEAFRREYSVAANEQRKRAYSTMYTEEEEQERMLPRFSRAPSLAPSSLSDGVDTKLHMERRKRSRTASVAPSQFLLGEQDRQVSLGAQDVGLGVIGSRAFLDEAEENAEVDQACDIPVPQAVSDWKVKRVEGDNGRIMVGPHIISLEEDLPPLATEHPARVWNCVIHSLPQELVPIIQWKYEKSETEDEGFMYICHVTLSLSPAHPAIAGHSAFTSLPANPHTPEYITAVADIGGSKTWTGTLQTLKTEATNSALTAAILGNAFEWLHHPDLVSEKAISLDEDQNGISTQAVCNSSNPPTQTLRSSPILRKGIQDPDQGPLEQEADSSGLQDPTLTHQSSPEREVISKAIPKLVPASSINNAPAVVAETFKKLPSDIKLVFALTVEWNSYTKGFVERLIVGVESCTQQYQAPSDPSKLLGSSVLDLAEQDDLGRFLRYIQNRFEIGQTPRFGNQDKPAIEVAAMGPPDDADMLVDWVEQLKGFCRANNLRYPSYSQQVHKDGQEVKFQASMKVEEDFFRAIDSYDTILIARQEIARWVFTEHFGQRAQPIESSGMRDGHDGGWKGGARGGKPGKGKKRW